MGCIMAIGVATSNSILMVTFANEQRARGFGGLDARAAALAAGRTRLRPVLMTALAMLLGMLPMSLGLGEGGEQNAPLGRAVIGGLLLATFYTLFFVPVAYSVLAAEPPTSRCRRRGDAQSTPDREPSADRARTARWRCSCSRSSCFWSSAPCLACARAASLTAAAERVRTSVPSVYVVQPVPAADGATCRWRQRRRRSRTRSSTPAPAATSAAGYVDIGDRVRPGQLLAEIASPEIDQQLRQAEADLRQSEKTLELQQCHARSRARHDGALPGRGRRERGGKEAVDQSVAAVEDRARRPWRRRRPTSNRTPRTCSGCEELTSFERVVAPFAGTIVQRNVDVGTLITAGSPDRQHGRRADQCRRRRERPVRGRADRRAPCLRQRAAGVCRPTSRPACRFA